MRKDIRTLLVGVITLATVGCTKFVTAPLPTTNITASAVYSSNASAAGALNGIYVTMTGNSVGGGFSGMSALMGLSADEFQLYAGAFNQLQVQTYQNALQGTATNVLPMWADLYNCIYQANSAISGISSSAGVTSSMKDQLIGEAEFVRAFCNFYLVNMYGNVPLVMVTSYNANEGLVQTASSLVYAQIVADLKDAQTRLGANYLTPAGTVTPERVRPNGPAATALLARVYLFEGKWDSAEAEATTVIGNSTYGLVQDLDSAFLASNGEAIWQLEIPDNGYNAPDGILQLAPQNFGGPTPSDPFILSDSLLGSFEPGDLRRVHWVDSVVNSGTTYYFPYKYKLYYTGTPPVEFPTILRLSEQFLIRAEARAEEGGAALAGAIADLNTVRFRAGLPGTQAVSQTDVLTAILRERRVELFTEYGHRWLDLKRTSTVNAVMTVVTPEKGGTWESTDALYPIPLSEITTDPSLVQNTGYN